MTKYELFQFVKNHLLTQNAKAINDNGRCMLRGRNNTKCAVGCLIPDSLYNRDLEEQIWDGEFINVLCNRLNLNKEDYFSVMTPLRDMHDHHSPSKWAPMIDSFEKVLFPAAE